MSSIKLTRATKLANKLPAAEAEILASIPAELHAQLTSKQLALVIEALDTHWQKALRFSAQQVLQDGCIWDGQELREVARKAVSA